MKKRFYADVIKNGQNVNLSVRAETEQEANWKLLNDSQFMVDEVLSISNQKPINDYLIVRHDSEMRDVMNMHMQTTNIARGNIRTLFG